MDQEVLGALSQSFPSRPDPEIDVQRLALLGLAHVHLQQFDQAAQELAQAQAICSAGEMRACGELLRARAGMAIAHGQYQAAYGLYAESLGSARRFRQSWDESVAMTNLSVACLLLEKFDEAIDWSLASSRIAAGLGAEDILLNSDGNQGWAYYKLGNSVKALEMYQDAERRAVRLGDTGGAIAWSTTAGYVYQDDHDLTRAAQSFQEALGLAKQIGSKEDIVNSLESLIHASIEGGNLDEAKRYLEQIEPLILANANPLDALDIQLARGRIAAEQRQDQQAEAIFREVEENPASQTSMRMGAGHELARLYELQGNAAAADRKYRSTLATFETARSQLKDENSKLPFLANAAGIYDDYIHFLVEHGKANEALEVADQSRARTLEQGLGLAFESPYSPTASLHPGLISQKAAATLLFYWLGERESYLWAITPNRTAIFALPARREIAPMVERYRRALLGPGSAVESSSSEGVALYRLLVAPVKDLIPHSSNVVILSDGVLSELNFETLVVPGASPHYWIEDATLISAPSLRLLESARAPREQGRRLLLMGDALSANPDYPELPMASLEIRQVQKHFGPGESVVFTRRPANPGAYLASRPEQFSYMHFVAHGVASRTDPLDSAIILSRNGATEDSFKLYARDIIQHPIHARLVTISACYGSGTRSFAGEGLVGLSWAFLRAGAHNVIGALWEVSDESTPRLMDTLYQGLEAGLAPGSALRQAKLSLLHSKARFRAPFYWASFQIYAGI